MGEWGWARGRVREGGGGGFSFKEGRVDEGAREKRPTVMVMAGPQKEAEEEFLEKASEGAEVMEVLPPLLSPWDALAVRLLMMPCAALVTVPPLVLPPVGV